MIKNKKAILPSTLIIVVTTFIFSNSLKNGIESKQDSDVFLNLFRPLLVWIFGEDPKVLNHVVRKAAHLVEFFILALLICWLSHVVKKKFHGYGLLYSLGVAIIDEFIQSFTGRTSRVLDILIDFSGALIGFGIFLLIKKLKSGKKDP